MRHLYRGVYLLINAFVIAQENVCGLHARKVRYFPAEIFNHA